MPRWSRRGSEILNTIQHLRQWHKNDDSPTSQEKRIIDEAKLKRWKDAAGKQHNWWSFLSFFVVLLCCWHHLDATWGKQLEWLVISVAGIQASMFAAKALPGIDVQWGDTSIESMRQSFAND